LIWRSLSWPRSTQQGHDARLIAARFVKPFVKSNKNDFIDAEAIAEALERKNMRFVPIECQLPPRVIDEAFTACGRVRQPAI
jgi:transposase